MKLGDFPHRMAEEADNERLLGPDWREASHKDVLDALSP